MSVDIQIVTNQRTPLQETAARLLKQKMLDNSLPVSSTGPAHISLNVHPGMGPEGYKIIGSDDNRITVTGSDDRGLLYGVGKLLRTLPSCDDMASLQIESVPVMPVRGMYFATHFHNFYHDAPLKEITDYLEELALWGCNALLVWFDMHHFDGLQDPHAQQMIQRLRSILQAANRVGIGAGLLFLANEGYHSSPQPLRVTPAPAQYNVELCPSKPEGLDLILKWRQEMLESFADLEIEYVCIWPHDQGGCGCMDCNPWGAKGFVKLIRELRPMVKKCFPATRIIVSTWWFDYEITGEYAGLWEAVQMDPGMLDYLMVDAHESFPQFVLEKGTPANKPVLNFTEISMNGMHPWGGFGINPLPQHIERLWQPSQHLLSGGFPYSEGIYEDINKVMVLQRYWDPERSLTDILYEYAASAWSPEHAALLVNILMSLEPDKPIRIHTGLEEELFQQTRELDAAALVSLRMRPLYAITDSTQADKALETIEHDLPEAVSSHWRWRILRIRALLGAELTRSGGKMTAVSERCFSELTRIYHAQGADPVVKPPSLDLIGSLTHAVNN